MLDRHTGDLAGKVLWTACYIPPVQPIAHDDRVYLVVEILRHRAIYGHWTQRASCVLTENRSDHG